RLAAVLLPIRKDAHDRRRVHEPTGQNHFHYFSDGDTANFHVLFFITARIAFRRRHAPQSPRQKHLELLVTSTRRGVVIDEVFPLVSVEVGFFVQLALRGG